MPQLNWDETDFLECLEVEPLVKEYEVQHRYEVARGAISLTLTVWQLESVVSIVLREKDVAEPLVEHILFVRGVVRYIHDKRGEYLEFQDCVFAPERRSYLDTNRTFYPPDVVPGWTVQLRVKPRINIRYE